MDPLSDDRALLDAFRVGDRPALERVYHAYVDGVFNLIRYGFLLSDGRRVAGLREANAQRELVQEVFSKAFAERARLSYDGLRQYRAYLHRIARNALIDAWRRRGQDIAVRAAAEDFTNVDPDPASSGGDARAVDELHWRALLQSTESCVSGMDDELRRYVQCRFVDDLSQRDAAAKMGVTRRRVRTLEERVFERLRQHLSSGGFL